MDKAVHNCIAFQDISSGGGLNHKSLSDTPAYELVSRGQYFKHCSFGAGTKICYSSSQGEHSFLFRYLFDSQGVTPVQ